MPKYDVIIKSHNKDYVKLPFVIDSIKYLVPQPEHIILINPDLYCPEEFISDSRILLFHDDMILPGCDRNKFKYRPNWCISTLMALFQDVTPNDYYLDIQGDNFFVREHHLFDENDRPIFYVSPQHKHFHPPYFAFNEKMFGIPGRVGAEWGIGERDSFIIDFMLYSKKINKEMLDMYGGIDNYFNKCVEIIDIKCHPSEQDLYPNWALSKHPELYVVKMNTQVFIDGKDLPAEFTKEEIQANIDKVYTNPEYKDVIAITCHSWIPIEWR